MKRSISNKHDELIGYLTFDENGSLYDFQKIVDTLVAQGFKIDYCSLPNLTPEEHSIRSNPKYIESRKNCFSAISQCGKMSFNILSLSLQSIKESFGYAGLSLIKKDIPQIEDHIKFS